MKFKKEVYIVQRQSKKTGTWTFQVRIRSDFVDVTRSFNELDYGSAKIAYESAVAFRNKSLMDIAEGKATKISKMTVKDCFFKYLNTSVLSCSSSRKHELIFNKYIKHKDTPIQKLTRADVIDDLNASVDIASDETIARILSIYKRDVIETAISHDLITRDVTVGIRVPKSHVYSIKKDTTTNRDTILKIEELLWNSPKKKYEYNNRIIYYMLETMYYTGMRPAEVEVLTRDDIVGNYISVTKELGSDKTKENVVRRPKTRNSIRKIPIHPNLKRLLDELQAYAKYDQLFVSEDGKYMNSSKIGGIIYHLARDHGIKFNMYMLRHNLATELVTNNVDHKTTMEILGHQNYNMSLYYANSNDELKENAIELLS